MKLFLVKKDDLKVISETTMSCIAEIKAVQEVVTERKQHPTYLKIEGHFETVDKYIIDQKRGIIPPKFLRKYKL